MKYIFGIALLFLFGCTGQKNLIQDFCTSDNISRSNLKNYYKAETELDRSQFEEALKLAENLSAEYPECYEIQFLHARAQYSLDIKKAKPLFENIYNSFQEVDPGIIYTLGKYAFDSREYPTAIKYYSEFLRVKESGRLVSIADRKLETARTRQKIIENSPDPSKVKIEKLPSTINTENLEYLPFENATGDVIIFTRRINGQEDIYYSIMSEDGKWQESQPLSSINTRFNEGGHCISADGKTIIYTFCNHKSGHESCDLLVSYLENNRWTQPEKLNYPVNTDAWESQPSLTPDGKYLYFTSNRKGGFGGSDIYRASRGKDNIWGNVINLKTLNTDGQDNSPFIASDYNTIYFSSDSVVSLGKRDLFMSRKDPYGNWTDPVNLGIPYSTENDDGTIFVRRDGKSAYLSSDRNGEKQLDIYEIELREDLRPIPATFLYGEIIAKESGEKIPNATITVLPYNDSTVIAESLSSKDGTYLFTLPMGAQYSIWVEKNGYIFYSDQINLKVPSGEENQGYEKNIYLNDLSSSSEDEESITLNNVFFKSGKSNLLPSANTELKKLKSLLTENPEMRIEISGHTDNVGSAQKNQILSFNRAKAVVDWLIEHGIDKSRLEYKGYGETQAVATNETEEGRQRNRRTEFKILN